MIDDVIVKKKGGSKVVFFNNFLKYFGKLNTKDLLITKRKCNEKG